MKILDILKQVGSSVIAEVVPGGGIIIDIVNKYLPDGKKLPEVATAVDVENALQDLPESDRASVLNREVDLKAETLRQRGATARTMLETEALTPHTTRPKIALGAFYVVSFISILTMGMWAFAVLRQDEALVAVIMNGWALPLSIIAPFVAWLNAYFGVLKKELEVKLGAPKTSVVSDLLNRITKR